TQLASILRVGQCRTRSSRCDPIVDSLAIHEAVPIAVTDSWNIDRRVERLRCLKVDDGRSEIAGGNERPRYDLALNTEIPRLTVRWREGRLRNHVVASRGKRSVSI